MVPSKCSGPPPIPLVSSNKVNYLNQVILKLLVKLIRLIRNINMSFFNFETLAKLTKYVFLYYFFFFWSIFKCRIKILKTYIMSANNLFIFFLIVRHYFFLRYWMGFFLSTKSRAVNIIEDFKIRNWYEKNWEKMNIFFNLCLDFFFFVFVK